MMRNIFVLAFLLYASCAFSQFSISGKITDEEGNALIGANITIEGKLRRSSTSLDGNYTLSALKVGQYVVIVSYIGYETYRQTLELKGNLNVDIALKPMPYLSEEVIVHGVRASDKDPVTKTNIVKYDFDRQNLGQDLPLLLNMTTSVVTTSDAGAGIGYTGIRIRGSDASRTNVTINGVPLNDAESQGIYWVDIPDFAENVDNIQIQRGVGTSTNGAGSFGATMNLQTIKYSPQPYAEIKSTAGSFNTYKNTLGVGTGLLNSRVTFDARASIIRSDGYIDRASSNLQSYFISGGYFSEKNIVKLNAFGGKEKTYQAWNGIPKVKLNSDTSGMIDYYNDQVAWNEIPGGTDDSLYIINSDPHKYNVYRYNNQTDNYTMNHFQCLFVHKFSNSLSLNTVLHYTRGLGYYEQFKPRQNLKDYTLDDIIIGNDTISTTDLIRRRWLDNYFFGGIFSLNFSNKRNNLSIGGSINQYYGHHYGQVIWAQHASNGNINHEWFRGKGIKDDMTIYIKMNHRISNKLSLYGDLQYRYIRYVISGLDKDLRTIDQKHFFNFFNPKIGATIQLNERQSIYTMAGISHKEPTRDNYVDHKPDTPEPMAEMLYNCELGYKTNANNYILNINYYLMYYIDQLVLTGALNDVGNPVMMNVENSYRHGIEIEGSIKFIQWCRWEVNSSFSTNKLKKYTNYLGEYLDDGSILWILDKEYGNVDIAFSPSIVAASNFIFTPLKSLEIQFQSKYVGKQYIDNTQSTDRMLDAYLINNLVLGYDFRSKYWKDLSINLMINNLFNKNYLANGWVSRYMYLDQVYTTDGYFPQAGINFLAGITIRF